MLVIIGIDPYKMLNVIHFMRNITSYSITKLLRSQPSEDTLIVKGWLKRLRKIRTAVFIDLDDGSSLRRLQVVVPTSICPKGLSYHTCLSIKGKLIKSPGPAQEVEFLASKLEVKSSMMDYFEREDFVNIDTPLLTTNDCEANGNCFAVKGKGKTLSHDGTTEVGNGAFGKPVYLTVSGQLHLEAMANGLSKVFCCNPAFRAEGDSRFHLHEFWMVEAEECFAGEDSEMNYGLLLDRIEDFVKFILRDIMDSCQDDVRYQWKFNKKDEILEKLFEKVINNRFIKVPFFEAIKILEEHKSELKNPVEAGKNLNRESELYLVKHFGGSPVFLTHWPIASKPFYMLTDTPKDIAYGVDLLVPLVGELVGGGLREHHLRDLISRVVDHGLAEDLAWYVDLRKWGYAPTGGFGIGLERFIQYLLGIDNIKDTIPFPRWDGHCIG